MAKVIQRLRDFNLIFPQHVDKAQQVFDFQILNILVIFLHIVENVLKMWKTLCKVAKLHKYAHSFRFT